MKYYTDIRLAYLHLSLVHLKKLWYCEYVVDCDKQYIRYYCLKWKVLFALSIAIFTLDVDHSNNQRQRRAYFEYLVDTDFLENAVNYIRQEELFSLLWSYLQCQINNWHLRVPSNLTDCYTAILSAYLKLYYIFLDIRPISLPRLLFLQFIVVWRFEHSTNYWRTWYKSGR